MTDVGTMRVKSGLADLLKGGVIMDVTNAEQAKIAEDAGACAVMAKARIGHLVEAQILQSLEVDYVDKSEVLMPAAPSSTARRGSRALVPASRCWPPVRVASSPPGRAASSSRHSTPSSPTTRACMSSSAG